ncbi:MAG: RNA polymerase sigma-70 factor [Cytophagaceae bacterium]
MEKSKDIDLIELERLFRSEFKGLCNSVYKIIRDENACKDVVQDVFFKLWKKRHELKIDSSLKGYLYRSAYNASLNYLESTKVLKLHTELKENRDKAFQVNDHKKLDQKELEEKILQAIEKLPPQCRVIFSMSRMEGLKYQQIADHLNLSLKTVENQMGIALEKLRESLKPFLSEEYILALLMLLLFC